MAVVNQLNLNVGTEQNPNFVLHDINDKRISTTAVTTATRILTCNSGVTSIAPITAANLASVLGVAGNYGFYRISGDVESASDTLKVFLGQATKTNFCLWCNIMLYRLSATTKIERSVELFFHTGGANVNTIFSARNIMGTSDLHLYYKKDTSGLTKIFLVSNAAVSYKIAAVAFSVTENFNKSVTLSTEDISNYNEMNIE